MNENPEKTKEKYIFVIGDQQSGKTSLISLISGKKCAISKNYFQGVRFDQLKISETNQKTHYSIYEFNFDDEIFMNSIISGNPLLLENLLLIFNFSMEKADLSFTKISSKIRKIIDLFEVRTKKLDFSILEKLKSQFDQFNSSSQKKDEFLIPTIFILNKFDQYLNLDV